MFNLGFGDLIDRFEKYFGKALTAWLLGITGASFALVAGGFAFQTVLLPAVSWLGAVVLGNETARPVTAGFNLLSAAIGFVLFIWISAALIRVRKDRGEILRIRDELAKIKKLGDEVTHAALRLKETFLQQPGGEQTVKELMGESAELAALWAEPKASQISPPEKAPD